MDVQFEERWEEACSNTLERQIRDALRIVASPMTHGRATAEDIDDLTFRVLAHIEDEMHDLAERIN